MEVLCLTISSRLSGTYSNASLAAKSVGGAIRIVDGRTTAGGSCLLLRHAAQRIREGAQLQPLAEELRALREQIGIAFSVTDMNPLRRSGRLGIVRQSVGTILNIRPILQLVQGGVVACDTARGKAGPDPQAGRLRAQGRPAPHRACHRQPARRRRFGRPAGTALPRRAPGAPPG